MVMPSTETFVETLRACELLDAPQLNELRRGFPLTGDDPRPLARKLMQQGWLTPYQINQLLTGHGRDLILGHYILMERLGEGGMGQVYKARHQKLGRMVALKVMRKDRMTEHDTIRRFQREIQAIAQLSHPNIVLAFDADEVHGIHFFAMEYFEGIDLNRLVRRLGALPVPKACDYIRQAALGLQHAHERGLVHRDVKPSNLLLTKGGPEAGGSLIKILDMGLARLDMPSDETESSQTLTQRGVIIGTADFIAPEQAMNPHGADIRCDLYSLGCTFYFLLTGKVPFSGGTPLEKLFRHRLEPPRPIQELRRDVPDVVADIVHRLLSKLPADRYQSPAALATDLTNVLAGGGSLQTFDNLAAPHTQRVVIVPGALDAAPPKRPSAVRRRRRRWVAAGSGLAFLTLTLTAAAWLLASGIGATTDARPSAATSAAPIGKSYLRRNTREDTILATLKANGYPTLEGKWHFIGPLPFDPGKPKLQHGDLSPLEFPVDLTKPHKGKGNKNVAWKEFAGFRLGAVLPLRMFDDNDNAAVFLHHSFEVKDEAHLPLSLGSDDTVTVWLNGTKLHSRGGQRGFAPDQDRVLLPLQAGKNELVIKVCNTNGDWGVYIMPTWPPVLETAFGYSLRRDFPTNAGNK